METDKGTRLDEVARLLPDGSGLGFGTQSVAVAAAVLAGRRGDAVRVGLLQFGQHQFGGFFLGQLVSHKRFKNKTYVKKSSNIRGFPLRKDKSSPFQFWNRLTDP